MINPNMMNEQTEEREGRYQKKESVEQPTISFHDEEPVEAQGPLRDEEIYPGVYESDIISWKKQFGRIWSAKVKGKVFIYRALERFEYKMIVGTPDTNPLMREEMICETCVLYPFDYSFATMTNGRAGEPAVVSELIMEQSAFTRDIEVAEL
jgi:hypothetical protein